ncbi:AraC family transcriptional regulator [Faecalicatena sp. AGMB00832]|uniref:AraC family transcriptional regulator n=1 Tax=Faecalicatena faecalis TaxID=2726362 RepID=A0ABS6D0J3_9FIRM|nr:AraC family transcriptional regulator [Faecalicatena faecalis]MBU3875094.1 AraC family transcriptional regulator [Faecalicatena faecalis]
MPSPKRDFPKKFNTYYFSPNSMSDSFPFTVKECGYCSERKFVLGEKNNYNEYLLLYSLDGTVRYTKDKRTFYVQPNSVITTACNTTLTFTRVSKEWKYYYFIIGGSHAKRFYNLVRTHDNIILCNPFANVLDHFMDLYYILTESTEPYNDVWKYIHSSMLIHNIFTSLYDLAFNISTIKEMTPAQENNINAALKYISLNYKDELSIETISNQVGFSKYYFCKIFKKQMGVTIHQYVNEFRINKAKELLAYSKLSINSIASQVGFKTTLTFLRAFERSVHMTPSEYRDYY